MSETKRLSTVWKAVLGIAAVAFSGFGVTLWQSAEARSAIARSWASVLSAPARVFAALSAFLGSPIGLSWGVAVLLLVVLSLVVVAVVAVRRAAGPRLPAFGASYTQDMFMGQRFAWRYALDSSGGLNPVELRLICRRCNCDMVDQMCPNCGYYPTTQVPSPREVKAVLIYRLRELEKQSNDGGRKRD
jgi:hypothetical protein